MNTERLNILADWLEAGAPHERAGMRFDMEIGIEVDHDNGCATACCIAGAAVQFFDPTWVAEKVEAALDDDFESGVPWMSVRSAAAALLDLDIETARGLFEPHLNTSWDLSDFKDPVRVARVVRHFAKTGTVDWALYDEPVS